MAVILALPLCAVGMFAVSSNHLTNLLAHGPIQKGHGGIACTGCHEPSDGTIRQQAQANVAYVLNRRPSPVDFGYQPVDMHQCLACHQRPNDRHPVYRFNEPRFSKVRTDLNANSCLGCHNEHRGERVSVETTFCSHCHSTLKVKNDPLDIKHITLISDTAWDTCLGCHDFHGNHQHKPQTFLSERFSQTIVKSYFEEGRDPYGNNKTYKAKNIE